MSARARKRVSYPIRFPINAIYFSGLIFIGTIVLLEITPVVAVLLAISMGFSYLAVSWAGLRLVCDERITKYFGKDNESSRFLKTVAISAMATVFPIAMIALMANAIMERMGPTEFYYYGIILGGIMFLTGVFAAGRIFESSSKGDGIETIKQKLSLQLEFLKSFMWAVLAVLLLTAYGQVLSGGVQASPGEMIVVAYSVFGFMVLVLAPLIANIMSLISGIRDLENKSK